MKKYILLLSLIVSVIFTGCGGGDSSSSSPSSYQNFWVANLSNTGKLLRYIKVTSGQNETGGQIYYFDDSYLFPDDIQKFTYTSDAIDKYNLPNYCTVRVYDSNYNLIKTVEKQATLRSGGQTSTCYFYDSDLD